MVLELVLRFLIGGLVVSAFAAIAEIFKPKSFAGIFGGAPSVALATLGLTFFSTGGADAATEGRSMMIGALALAVYSLIVGKLLTNGRVGALISASASYLAWAAIAFGVWAVALR